MALMERLVRWSAGVMDAEMMGTAWMSPQRSRAMVSWRSRARGTSRHFSASIRSDRAEARVFGEVWWHTVNLILCHRPPPFFTFLPKLPDFESLIPRATTKEIVRRSFNKGNRETTTRKSLLLLLAPSDRAYERLCTYERPSRHTI